MAEKVTGPASYFRSIEAKYGKPIAEWQSLIRARQPAKHMELVAFLKDEHGMGHGHAYPKQNAEVGKFVATEEAEVGMAEMAERYRDGGDLYVRKPASDRKA